ncbi:sulfotransferase family 2 domain-containing protein [Tateyamaria sp.]|uniref:sulfotransferase family 2 domain-containing protein n=1 Tax=Tateyamaria sp. TaxID=1929288 RepID=UPI0039B9BCE2
MAVPKAACSSIKAALAVIDPTQDTTDPMTLEQKQVHNIYPTQRFRMHRWDQVLDYFRFTVVRDPLKRLLGVYTNRVVGLRKLHNCRKIKRGRVNLTADPDPDYFSKPVWLHCGVILGQTPSLADGRLYRR